MSTNIPPNLFNYHFYPVGQGLFSAGSLHRTGEDVSRFQWVYDCGTTSSPTLVDRAIKGLETWSGKRRQLDLVVLSHFDKDHISGICQLIAKFPVKILLLPYMPLAERLVIAFEEGVTTADPLMTFFVNPVQYLTSVEGADIRQVLLVPPSTGDGPPIPDGGPAGDNDGEGIEATFRSASPENDEEFQSLQPGNDRSSSASVALLTSATAILLRGLWEFVPYNDDPVRPIPDDFESEVSSARNQLQNGPNREAALTKLKSIYDRVFGDDSKPRNIISLFVYAGPIYSTWEITSLLNASRGQSQIRAALPSQCSMLYTGDGYLDNDDRLEKLLRYLRPQRIRRVGALQVMHHGAATNYCDSVATKITPLFSVFSSDPYHVRYKHPHDAVLRGFYDRGPLRVDKEQSATIFGWMLAHGDSFGEIHDWAYYGPDPTIIDRQIQLTTLLLAHGADVNARANNGKTPLHLAAECSPYGAAVALLNRGANIYAEDNNGSSFSHQVETAFQGALSGRLASRQGRYQHFVKTGAPPKTIDEVYQLLSAWPLVTPEAQVDRNGHLRQLFSHAQWEAIEDAEALINALRANGESPALCESLMSMVRPRSVPHVEKFTRRIIE